jgi:hypothetical protein
MREIKYKGISKESGEWVYGDLLNTEITEIFNNGTLYKVDPKTVCEYIGIYCIKEIPIFSDDIIKHNQTRYIITWSKEMVCYICVDPDNKTRSGLTNWRDLQWLNNVKKYVNVIGNIHENNQ